MVVGTGQYSGIYAAKVVRHVPPVIRERFHNDDSLMFAKSYRLSFGGDLANSFAVLTTSRGVLMEAFQFVATFLVTSATERLSWVVQHWIQDLLPLNNTSLALCNTLGAFSHFTVTFGDKLYFDF
ncbi:hypothetical protein JAAARDRAFT_588106 [Jaapia argillacea MUCL 33604]|uniref:Uncharacterized protein n=1 Tax=Jaapia argillacea MUCL 33604 TaxID=933084 RepID=A0A067PH50_9AGAM|nr:hypothetical protein JAAARDRAFT_588106 [Jaapia argillacea MUCL 33604]